MPHFGEIRNITQLGDLVLVALANGDVIVWDAVAGHWVNQPPAAAGVETIREAGQPQLTGDVTLSEGANVTITQAGQDIEIAAVGAGGPFVDSIREAGQPQLTGDVTLSEGAGITLTQVGQDIEIAQGAAAVASDIGAYHAKVEPEGANFVAREPDGTLILSSASEELAIQAAINSLTGGRTWQEKVLLKGNFPALGDTIVLPSYTYLELIGAVKLDDSINKPLIENEHKDEDGEYDLYITVKGGLWDGNKANQASGYGFDFRGHNASYYNAYIEILDLHLMNCKDRGINLYYVWANSKVNDVRVRYGDGYGIYMHQYVDSFIHNSIFSGTGGPNMYLYSGAGNNFSNIYLGGTTWDSYDAQLMISLAHNCQWSNIFVDNPNTVGVKIYNDAYQHKFTNLSITTADYPTAIKHALILDDAYRNMFANLFIGKKDPAGAKVWDKGILEQNGADYNSYASGIIKDCTNADTTLGGNSKLCTDSFVII